MKKTLFAMLLTLACLCGTQGQRFEWAKGYASAQQGSEIKGTVADREGNLYILGTFRNDARWDGEPLLPITPYGYNPNTINVLIAKISPSGQMLWKKVIHSNNGQNSIPYDIKPVGDTAFACLVQLSLSRAMDNYLYYLDTLIEGDSDYPLPIPYFGSTSYTTYLQFDFDGRVQEQHFLQVGYLDADGNDLANPSQLPHIDPTPWYVSDVLYYPSFDVDAAGNIYLSRIAINATYCCLDSVMEYSVEAGTISAVKYWVDHRLAGVNYIDPYHRPQNGSPELLVFSPHFDTLLTSRYLFQHYNKTRTETYLRMDRYGGLYAYGHVGNNYENDSIVIDAERRISFPVTPANHTKGYLVKLDSALMPLYCVTLEDSVINPNLAYSATLFQDVSFDYDSSIVFLCAVTGRGAFGDTNNIYSILMYRGQTLENIKNDVFFLAFRMDDGSLESYGKVPSICGSDLITGSHGNIVSTGNRIFMQSKYAGGIHLPYTSIHFSSRYDESIGMQIFDYRGNVVGGLHYAATDPSQTGSITLVDSVLYMSNLLRTSATFGDIAVPEQGYHACIAKYVDTAFLTPYRAEPDTGDVRVVMVEDQGAWTHYPNPFRQRVNIEYQGSEPLRTTATLTDATGRSTEVRLSEQGTGRYRLDFAGVPQPRGSRVLFLTLTTASGRQHTLQLMTAWE